MLARFARRDGITDKSLREAIERAESGLKDANTVATFMMFVGSASLPPFLVVGAAVIPCIGTLLNGRDDFRRLLYLNAFAHLPLICGSLISIFVFLVWSPHVDSSVPGQITVASAVDDIRSCLDEVLRSTPVFLVRVFGYMAQVWAFILFAYNALHRCAEAKLAVSDLREPTVQEVFTGMV